MAKYVYIHIPFCNSICSYCDFCKIFYNEKIADKYLDKLKQEITTRYNQEKIKSIYIGGGTPSSLNMHQLEKLFSIIKTFKKDNDFTFTIEANFDSINEEKLKLFKNNSVTRISFGLESIDKNNLAFLERKENPENIRNIINLSKEYNFDINIDLMYALPTEDMTILNKDLDFIFSLDVNHISTYSLIIEDNTKLKIKNIKNISEDLDFLMYKNICKRMKKNNYLHYEISNFCKENHESVHNLCYWENEEYYGFGVSASSYINNKRFTNTKSITEYLEKYSQSYSENVSKEDKMDYEVILNLRLSKGISLTNFYKKYHKYLEDIYDYEDLVQDKLLVLDNNRLYISEEKWYISNEIIRRLLERKK